VNKIGIFDEMRLLQFGEVYLHYSGRLCSDAVESALPCSFEASEDPWDPLPNGDPPRGLLLETSQGSRPASCPCLHPGDVRVLRAVPLDELVARAGGLHSDRGRATPRLLLSPAQCARVPTKG
jgi:hypothetical protein